MHKGKRILFLLRWECCKGEEGDIGCRTRYTCCKNDIALKSSEEGCQKRYACCRGRMEDPGCTQVRHNLYISTLGGLRIFQKLKPLCIKS